MTQRHASEISPGLPVVSLAGLHAQDPALRQQVGDAIRAACLDKGFLYIVDHGIAPSTQTAMFDAAQRFFTLPDAQKAETDMALSPHYRGWERMRGQTLQTGTPPDLKEGFYIGNELPAGDPRLRTGGLHGGPNQWPRGLPGWRETLTTYFEQMEALCARTMQALALALALPQTHFDAFCTGASSNLKLLHYPPQPANPLPDEKGCGAHTDWGAITYLLQDDAGGLQVWDASLGWIDAPPIPGSYVLNLGDLIARWTNDRFRSTLHRVINRSGRERYSIPFFYNGAADHQVVCLPNCLAPGEQPHYAPTTASAHLQEMYARSYA